MIDAGHGGKDPGASGSFSCEKNITLAIALKTGEYIEKNIKNVTVIYTRKNDTFVELKDRPKLQIRTMLICSFQFMPTGQTQRIFMGLKHLLWDLQKTSRTLKCNERE